MRLLTVCALLVVSTNLALPVRAEVLLAVGTVHGPALPAGGVESAALVLRCANGVWLPAPLPATATGHLRGAAFSSPTVAWAYGLDRELRPLLLRSVDAGVTWTDASAAMPQADAIDLFPTSMVVAGEQVLLVARNSFSVGPYVSTSEDGGATWGPFVAGDLSRATFLMLAVVDGQRRLTRTDASGTHVENLDESFRSTGPVDGVSRFQAEALKVAESRTWLAGSVSEKLEIRPALWSIDSLGFARSHAVSFTGSAVLSAVDVRDGAGVAAGMKLGDASGPILLHGRDGGEAWQEGVVAEAPERMAVRGIVLADNGDAWAVGHGHGTSESAILLSTDKGATWQRVPGPFDAASTLFALARPPTR